MISKLNFRKKFFTVAITAMLSVILFLGTLIIPVFAAESTTVKVNPLTQTITSGSTFTISIVCIPSQSIKAFELQVVFNPSLLKANSVSKGTIFKSYSTFFNAGSINNVAGTITNIYDVILGSGSTSSSGTLVTISFTAKSTTGISSIKLNNVGITNNLGYIPISIINGSVQVTTPSGNPPVFEYMSPVNKSSNIPISTTALSLTIRDSDSDYFDYTIQTSPDVGRISVTRAQDGTKRCVISGLKYATTYRWYVNATDGVNWNRRWYTFTTAQDPANDHLIISDITPSNGATNVPISTSEITVTVKNTQDHTFDMTVKTNPNIGSQSRIITVDGTKSFSISGLTYNTNYVWYIFCKDLSNGQWINQSYWFRTESKDIPSSPPSATSEETPPPSAPPYEVEPPTNTEQNNPPDPPITPIGPTFIETGVNYYFISKAYDNDFNDTVRLRFDWGDGTYSNWTGLLPSNVTASLSHTWRNASSYNISVIAQDENGLNSSWSNPLPVTVSPIDIEEEIAILEILTSSDNITTYETIQFDASNSVIPGRIIMSYYWEFGDGSNSVGKAVAHTYTTPGQYTVTLEITDHLGEIYTKKINITVGTTAQAANQDKMNLPSILISFSLIGTVLALIFLLILYTKRETIFFRRYIVYGRNWLKRLFTKIPRINIIPFFRKYIVHGRNWSKRLFTKITRINIIPFFRKYIVHGRNWSKRPFTKIPRIKPSTFNKPIPRPKENKIIIKIKQARVLNTRNKIDDLELINIRNWIDNNLYQN